MRDSAWLSLGRKSEASKDYMPDAEYNRVDKTDLDHTADCPGTAQQWSEEWACSCQTVTR